MNHSGNMDNTITIMNDISKAAEKGIWELLPCDSSGNDKENPVLPIHAALLRTGKVLLIAGSGNSPEKILGVDTNDPNDPRLRIPRSPFRSVVYGYEDGTFKHLSTPTDVFCAGHSFLKNGRLLVAGGTKLYDNFIGEESAYLFDPMLQDWIRVQDMADGRWYPTLVTLGDGRVFTISGLGGNGAVNRVHEIYSMDTGWTSLAPINYDWPLYPHLFLLRDGSIFYSGGNMGGRAGLSPLKLDINTNTTTNIAGITDIDRRDQAGSVLLPPAQDQRVMIMGGGDPATSSVNIVDLSSPNPAYMQASPLHFPRMHLNAILLPDRTVFVFGGGMHSERDPQLSSEIYDPTTDTWTIADTARVPRLYHSIGVLLPDGRVLAAGSNPNRRDDELRLELFHPPYLFKGPRPFVERTVRKLVYGRTFEIHTPQAEDIKWVHLIRPMATTHSCDTEQRLVDIKFKANGFCRLKATAPHEPNIAPPGWYMLFIANRNKVPSIAKWVCLVKK
jgi:hypothetical protein